jgi:ribosomal protein S12
LGFKWFALLNSVWWPSFAVAIIRDGRTPGLPRVKYKLIRNKYDFYGLVGRRTARSQYGTKKEKNNSFFVF